MTTMECPSCALDIVLEEGETRPDECPYCGYEFPERSKSVGAVAWLMAAILLLPVLWVLSRLF